MKRAFEWITIAMLAGIIQILSPAALMAQKVVASYVTAWTDVMPDPTLLTHINYAFGGVKSSFNGVELRNEQRLRDIVALKEINPELKVLLSIGGWGSGNFSEMAASKEFRESFCQDCARIVSSFHLDGIDIDWEYPGNGEGAHISWSPDDKSNFTLLMANLRKFLGPDRLLTLASCCDPKYIDFPSIMEYVDYVNIMSYDMEFGAVFHCALYPSEHTGEWSVDRSVQDHIKAGVPADKVVMGVPFYGRGVESFRKSMDFRNIYPIPEGYTEQWDKSAHAPYISDSNGEFVFGFENARSLRIKCDYIKEQGLLGIMNWDYSLDDENLTLTRIMHSLVE